MPRVSLRIVEFPYERESFSEEYPDLSWDGVRGIYHEGPDNDHPVYLIVTDDVHGNRWTFRSIRPSEEVGWKLCLPCRLADLLPDNWHEDEEFWEQRLPGQVQFAREREVG